MAGDRNDWAARARVGLSAASAALLLGAGVALVASEPSDSASTTAVEATRPFVASTITTATTEAPLPATTVATTPVAPTTVAPPVTRAPTKAVVPAAPTTSVAPSPPPSGRSFTLTASSGSGNVVGKGTECFTTGYNVVVELLDANGEPYSTVHAEPRPDGTWEASLVIQGSPGDVTTVRATCQLPPKTGTRRGERVPYPDVTYTLT